MLANEIDPLMSFVHDGMMYGTEGHIYKGVNAFECVLNKETILPVLERLPNDSLYYLFGVKPGLKRRAADADVLWRNILVLDFDAKKELEKQGKPSDEAAVRDCIENIIGILEPHQMWGQFRYVILSGGGGHFVYVGEPVEVIKENWVAGCKTIFEEVAEMTPIPPDFGVGNSGRIIRLPCSMNCKYTPARPVSFLVWQTKASLPPLEFIQKRGAHALAKLAERQEAERKDFALKNPDGGSDVIELINRIPIEQVVKQILNCSVSQEKKDGGMRFVDEHGKERGFFKHQEHNIIVHEGSSLFPAPSGVGYNPLGLVKVVKGIGAREAILWFAERMGAVREAMEREKREWAAENASHEVEMFEQKFPTKQ